MWRAQNRRLGFPEFFARRHEGLELLSPSMRLARVDRLQLAPDTQDLLDRLRGLLQASMDNLPPAAASAAQGLREVLTPPEGPEGRVGRLRLTVAPRCQHEPIGLDDSLGLSSDYALLLLDVAGTETELLLFSDEEVFEAYEQELAHAKPPSRT